MPAETPPDDNGSPAPTIDQPGPDSPVRRDAWTVTTVAVAAALIAACLAAGIAAGVPSRSAATGIPDAGQLTELALPALKALFDLSAALTVGWLVAAVVLVPPQRSGIFDVGGYRAIRAASLSAWVWTASALALIPVTLSDLGGTSLLTTLKANAIIDGLSLFQNIRGYLIAGIIAALIAIISRIVLRPGWAAWLLLAALGGLLPQALSGHASASSDHDIAVDTMIYHLVGISIWIGGLLAFLGLARQHVPHLDVIARRYSAIALVAFIAVAASGIGNAWVRLTYLSDLWTTPYGRLIVIKAVALIALGVIGFAHRQRTLPAIARGDNRALIRLATVEVLLMAATIGVAAALGRTAPPPPSGIVPDAFDGNLQETLGFTLGGAPTPWRLLVDWRFDYLLGTASLVAAGLYLWGVRRLHRRGDRWPPGRTVAWLLGCLCVLLATSSGLGRYAQSQFSIHMIAHMTLGMGAPILLALGGPISLALRVLPAARRDGVPGLREAIVATMHSRLVRFFTHPLVVLPLFIGSFYAVYFTPLFEMMMTSHFGHVVMNVHFLVVGYLYYWVIIGVDPKPRQLQPFVKLALLLLALPFHAFFGLALMNSQSALAASYYRGLALPWAPDLVSDQRLGGGIAWGVTELPMLIVLVALMAQWAKADDRENKRTDRRIDAHGDVELDAYNEMLAGLARGSRRPAADPPDRPAPPPPG